ncbi:MAG TPA: hypothetical protein VIC26_10065 [Marinagarivorans sp.]
MNRRDRSKRNVRTAIAMLVVILCIAVASWLYMSYFSAGAGRETYQNVTFTDALLECRNYTHERYGDSLQYLVMDDHSSRWEQRSGVYKVFFKATLRSEGSAEPRTFWVACDVSGQRGTIRDYDVSEEKATKNGAQRRNDGGIFGWP